jgi:hypothetical protein
MSGFGRFAGGEMILFGGGDCRVVGIHATGPDTSKCVGPGTFSWHERMLSQGLDRVNRGEVSHADYVSQRAVL